MSLPYNIGKAFYDKVTSEASTASLPDVAKVYAKMSSQAYEDPDERAHMIGGFEYKREYSNQLVGVYYLQNKNLYVIAIKGKKVQVLYRLFLLIVFTARKHI